MSQANSPADADAEPTPNADAMAGPTGGRRPSRLRIGWIMPEFIRELPVNVADTDEVAESLHAIATDLMPEHSADDQLRFAFGIAAQLEAMAEADVIYAGLCFLEVEGRPTASTVMVSQVEHDSEDEASLLRTTRELLERKHPEDEYQEVELPCGPALTRIGGSGFVLAAESSPTGAEELIPQSEIQVFVPLPDTAEMLIFELASPSPEGWDLHSELFAEILKTIDWGTDQEIEEYRAIQQAAPLSTEPDEVVKQEIFWHSSRLMDAAALRGTVGGGHQVNSTTCETCWGKGLRSPCSATHAWHIENVAPADLQAALARVSAAFAANGWEGEQPATSTSLRMVATDGAPPRSSGYVFTTSVDLVTRTFTANVASPCTRSTAPADAVFG
ncbi:hypothetical protein [Streptomyces sp. NPDC017993]|uniref:hypothetical protein n=1 Tax=Streptomyces sp. NPDC017993 TaxID=3365027 RepID=UPI0037B62A6C